MSWLSKSNIHTTWIEEALGVNRQIALRVQDEINKHYHLDWSEATLSEIKLVAMDAFETLNETGSF
jgi:hypothetical protein